jgi:hypothetical protein
MLFRRGNRKKATHRTPLIWRTQAPDQGSTANKVNLFVSSVLFVFWYHSPNFLDTLRNTVRCRMIANFKWVSNWKWAVMGSFKCCYWVSTERQWHLLCHLGSVITNCFCRVFKLLVVRVFKLLTLSDPMSDIIVFLFPTLFLIFNPFLSHFSATRILSSFYLFWAGKRLVDYL